MLVAVLSMSPMSMPALSAMPTTPYRAATRTYTAGAALAAKPGGHTEMTVAAITWMLPVPVPVPIRMRKLPRVPQHFGELGDHPPIRIIVCHCAHTGKPTPSIRMTR